MHWTVLDFVLLSFLRLQLLKYSGQKDAWQCDPGLLQAQSSWRNCEQNEDNTFQWDSLNMRSKHPKTGRARIQTQFARISRTL